MLGFATEAGKCDLAMLGTAPKSNNVGCLVSPVLLELRYLGLCRCQGAVDVLQDQQGYVMGLTLVKVRLTTIRKD